MKQVVLQDYQYMYATNLFSWKNFEGKTILLTGVTGLVGGYILEYLLWLNSTHFNNRSTIIALVRNKIKLEERLKDRFYSQGFIVVEQELANPISINQKIDYILHLASNATPKYFFSDPVGTINANVLGTHNLLNLASLHDVSGFLFFSTGEVYGDTLEKKDMVGEDDYGIIDHIYIRNCYAESKRLSEAMCCAWYHQNKIPAKIVRLSHTYGYGFDMADDRAMASFVKAVIAGNDIVLKSDGSAKRSFCYLADAVLAYFLVLIKGECATAYNVGNSYEISIIEMANHIIKASCNENIKISFDYDKETKLPSNKASHGMLDVSKIKELGWSPKINEQEGFQRVLRYYKEDVENVYN